MINWLDDDIFLYNTDFCMRLYSLV